MLYGPDGRPLPPPPARELTRRVAQPTRTGWRRAQQWRSVVTTLEPARLRNIYHALAQGTWVPDFFELAEEIEERDLHYRGVLQQRKLRAAGAAIDVVPASDAAADRAIADEVREQVVQGPGFHDLLLELLDALGKGVGCVEIVWRREGARRWRPAGYHRVDPRWLVFRDDDGDTPLLLRDRTSDSAMPMAATGYGWSGWSMPADELTPGKFVYHRHRAKSGLATRGGLAYSVATMYLLKSIAVRDWFAYGELFGLPIRVGKYGQNATDDDIRTLEDAIAALAADAGCVIPESMDISLEMPTSGGGSAGPQLFVGQADWCDRQVSKAVVGQTMTTDDGSSRSQAEVHAEVRDDLVEDDVRQLCQTITEGLVVWYCRLNHPPRAAGWPRVELPQPPEEVDLDRILKAADRGLRVPVAWLYERLGIPAPQGDEEVLAGRRAAQPGAPAAPELHAGDPAAAAAERALAEMTGTGAITDGLAEIVRTALANAEDADTFLEIAAAAEVPEALAEDLALRRFQARVDAETGEG